MLPTKLRGMRKFVWLLGAVVLAGMVALVVWANTTANSGAEQVTQIGSTTEPDWVEISASIVKVDASSGELLLRLQVVPQGGLTNDLGVSPNEDLEILTSRAIKNDTEFPADTRISSVDLPVSLSGTAITAYPFDLYEVVMEFSAMQGGRSVPVLTTVTNRDAMFSVSADASVISNSTSVELEITRAHGPFGFAIFMIVAMWALCIAVLIGTRFIATRRRGLIWPALGWMAATLFALAAFRNAAPGAPPIGSMIDYLAFFWAEAVITVCILVTVIVGVKNEPAES